MLGIDRSAARYTWTAAMVLLFLYLVYLVRSTLFIFALALLFAYLLSPLVNLLDRAIPKEGHAHPGAGAGLPHLYRSCGALRQFRSARSWWPRHRHSPSNLPDMMAKTRAALRPRAGSAQLVQGSE